MADEAELSRSAVRKRSRVIKEEKIEATGRAGPGRVRVSERINRNVYGDPMVVQGGRHLEHEGENEEVNHRIAQVSILNVESLLCLVAGVATRLQVAVAPVRHAYNFAAGPRRERLIQQDAVNVLQAVTRPLTEALTELLALEFVLTERLLNSIGGL